MHDLVGSYQRLEYIYRMYIKSAFPLRDRAIAREREELLKTQTLLSQPPLLETVPVYPPSGLTLDDAADSLLSEYSDIRHLAKELFPPHLTLYNHQWQSLNATLGKGRDIVVTTGTGSGKTGVLSASIARSTCLRIGNMGSVSTSAFQFLVTGGKMKDKNVFHNGCMLHVRLRFEPSYFTLLMLW